MLQGCLVISTLPPRMSVESYAVWMIYAIILVEKL